MERDVKGREDKIGNEDKRVIMNWWKKDAFGDVLDREGVLDGRDPLHRQVREALLLVVAAPRMQDLSRWMCVSTKARADQPAAACACSFAVPPSRSRWRRCAVLHADVDGRLIRLLSGSRVSRSTRSKSITDSHCCWAARMLQYASRLS
jgi:hypothetical protein